MKFRVKELASALEVDSADILAICSILKLPATSVLSSLSLQQAKKITDYYEEQCKN